MTYDPKEVAELNANRKAEEIAKSREALAGDNDQERLTRWYNQETWKGASALNFGRKMPFGKHKGMYMYCLIVKHPMYLNWILNNTGFRLTQDESWWKQKIDDALDRYRFAKICSGLASQMHLGGVYNIENPHWIVE